MKIGPGVERIRAARCRTNSFTKDQPTVMVNSPPVSVFAVRTRCADRHSQCRSRRLDRRQPVLRQHTVERRQLSRVQALPVRHRGPEIRAHPRPRPHHRLRRRLVAEIEAVELAVQRAHERREVRRRWRACRDASAAAATAARPPPPPLPPTATTFAVNAVIAAVTSAAGFDARRVPATAARIAVTCV